MKHLQIRTVFSLRNKSSQFKIFKVQCVTRILERIFNPLHWKKPIGIFTENTVNLFNKFIKEIEDSIDVYLGRMHEVELNKQGLLDFGDFFDIKYDTDGEGQVYPDVYSEFSKGSGESKKKKKGGKGGKFPISK